MINTISPQLAFNGTFNLKKGIDPQSNAEHLFNYFRSQPDGFTISKGSIFAERKNELEKAIIAESDDFQIEYNFSEDGKYLEFYDTDGKFLGNVNVKELLRKIRISSESYIAALKILSSKGDGAEELQKQMKTASKVTRIIGLTFLKLIGMKNDKDNIFVKMYNYKG